MTVREALHVCKQYRNTAVNDTTYDGVILDPLLLGIMKSGRGYLKKVLKLSKKGKLSSHPGANNLMKYSLYALLVLGGGRLEQFVFKSQL